VLSVEIQFLEDEGVSSLRACAVRYTGTAMPIEPSDEELMLRYGSGDAAAFDLLYARHRGGVFRYLLRQCGSRTVAEELLQDIWTNLIQARARYKVEAKFTTWLYALARHRLIDHFRRNKGAQLVSLNVDGEDSDPLEVIAQSTAQPERIAQAREQAAQLLWLVESLPTAQREAFLLHEEGGLSLEQIAEVTGVERETVKSRLRYALDKLRKGMKDHL